MFHSQAVEQDDLVQPVEEFGTEMSAHHVHHLRFDIFHLLIVGHAGKVLAAEVGGEDDQRVAEVHDPALPVGQTTIVEHLQQNVEDIAVGFLDFVEQHHLIGPAPDSLGEDAAFFIAHIAGRRADQTGDSVLFHEFAHVDAHHRGIVVEQEPGERLGQFGLANAGGAEEQEAAERSARILEPGTRAAHGLADRVDGLTLADHPLRKDAFHLEQLFALALHHLVDGDTGPAADDTGDVVFRDLFPQQGIFRVRCRFGEFLLEFGYLAVGKLTSLCQIACALRLLQFKAGVVEFFLDPCFGMDLVALVLPARGQLARLLFELGQFLAQGFEPVLGRGVAFLLQGLFFDAQLDDPAVETFDFFRFALHFHADA